jgi:hypothetical protein
MRDPVATFQGDHIIFAKAWYFSAVQLNLRRTKHGYATAIRQFLQFTSAHPSIAVVEDQAPQAAGQNQQEPTMPQQWLLEKLIDDKSRTDDLIAKLGGKLMDHYLYFQSRIKGEGENMDNICRLADEAQHLIESNLALFIHLSSGGRKIHKTILECYEAAGRRLTSHW